MTSHPLMDKDIELGGRRYFEDWCGQVALEDPKRFQMEMTFSRGADLSPLEDNTELRKLLIETSSKSIIMIKDIDCSLDLTGQRKEKPKEEDEDEKNPMKKLAMDNREAKPSKKLDPALIRKGRMDKHIELSYCGFKAFNVLVKNYLGIKSHCLFRTIEALLAETNMTPADVAEHLIPKTKPCNIENHLKSLIRALEQAKEGAMLKNDYPAKEAIKDQ
ncbi:hypothetical protein CRG98_042373 [Punica granatum]|uniref:AAA+ ATPase At3g28540-like C-terminal domain-containing protein n=1 Tax=Punica granatum TaxID=22663 RepID=A0A2I0HZT0_PUNGR|nr:hypothetical protein CRG98_042373 [Punica granatum]